MTALITPQQLSAELRVSDRTIRQGRRDQAWQSVPYARWELTADQAAQVRAHFQGDSARDLFSAVFSLTIDKAVGDVLPTLWASATCSDRWRFAQRAASGLATA